MTELVIASYRGDLSWLKQLPIPIEHLWIYHKGPDPLSTEWLIPSTIQSLSNVGREGHTYLHHLGEHTITRRIVFTVDTVGQDPKRLRKLHECLLSNGTHFPVLESENITFQSGFSMKNYQKIPQILANPRPYAKWYRRWIRNTLIYVKKHGWSYNGIFAVTPEHIHKYPPKYYRQLRDQLSVGDQVEAGHFLERSWRTMWI